MDGNERTIHPIRLIVKLRAIVRALAQCEHSARDLTLQYCRWVMVTPFIVGACVRACLSAGVTGRPDCCMI